MIKFGYTHSGKFHADDVFSSALLKILYPEIKIIRCNKVPDNVEDSIVFDIGRGVFDHHQTDAEIRENGMPYAAFGLLWREFGSSILGDINAEHFDESFIQTLDYSDNCGKPNTLATVIAAYNPTWDSEISRDEAFEQAVILAKEMLIKMFDRYKGEARAETLVKQAYENKIGDVVVLERFLPFRKVLKETEINFVVYPSDRGGYCIMNIDRDEGARKFPETWCGLEEEALQRESGLSSARFCHNGGFLLAAETIEDCLLASKSAIWHEKIIEE